MNNVRTPGIIQEPFRHRLTFEQRQTECERIRSRRPQYIPTIVEMGSKTGPQIDREKFLLPHDLTGVQLSYVLRRRLRMNSSEALFLISGGHLVTATDTMVSLHTKHKSADGFLYIAYTMENTFG